MPYITQIIKDLNAVLQYAKHRFQNEFKQQEFELNDTFKNSFFNFLKEKNCEIEFFRHTSVITTKANQNIFIANQWFVIASYMVDFCTELLTYKELYLKICTRIHRSPEQLAKKLKVSNDFSTKPLFVQSAKEMFNEIYKDERASIEAAGYLWNFISNYSWWAGSKTVDRNDFYVSPILNSLNVVNVSHGYVADIVFAYSTNFSLRKNVESVSSFTIGAKLNAYTPDAEESASYKKAEKIDSSLSLNDASTAYLAQPTSTPKISISAASLDRFKRNG
ncbi:MAG: hypothetical protein MJY47_04575 [Fibrobacter sp.]|nr:hypothetical protein [Fibrobacter sp.]